MERSFKAAAKLRCELPMDIEMERIPLMELSSLVEDIHVKTWEASQNTDLDMGEFLGINKALQSIQGKLLNYTSKRYQKVGRSGNRSYLFWWAMTVV